MEKNLLYAEMLDIYRDILTPKQAEALDYYYDKDYSLGEISELMDISRQGVRDFIKRGETVMSELESKLNLIGKFNELRKIAPAVNEIKALNKRYSEVKDIDRLSDEILQVMRFIEKEVE
ncbi:MAG: sigma factor-like helix-turn-helix DNA-binding protein [Clostridia bacterium]|nr:sigma factor-like helix-turn-helix DNA-binding protein [Clostridia bacterium]